MENITTMLIYGIITGCGFILIAMILNIINGLKNKDFKRTWLERKWSCRISIICFCIIFNSILFYKRKNSNTYKYNNYCCFNNYITNTV